MLQKTELLSSIDNKDSNFAELMSSVDSNVVNLLPSIDTMLQNCYLPQIVSVVKLFASVNSNITEFLSIEDSNVALRCYCNIAIFIRQQCCKIAIFSRQQCYRIAFSVQITTFSIKLNLQQIRQQSLKHQLKQILRPLSFVSLLRVSLFLSCLTFSQFHYPLAYRMFSFSSFDLSNYRSYNCIQRCYAYITLTISSLSTHSPSSSSQQVQ